VPRALKRYLTLDDFEATARRRIPKFLYGYISGAPRPTLRCATTEKPSTNMASCRGVLNDVSGRNQTTTLFGKHYASPFAFRRWFFGAVRLSRRRRADARGRRSQRADDPLRRLDDKLETCAARILTPGIRPIWRACPSASSRWSTGWRRRVTTLFVVTADVPVPPNRENNIRSGFGCRWRSRRRLPGIRRRIRTGCSVPGSAPLKNHGMPHFENMDAQRGPPALAKNLMRNIGNRDQLAWKHVELIRKRWKGKLVVKGLIAPQDARIAREFRPSMA